MSFVAELKRRHVFKIGIAYIVAGWVVLQVADVIVGNVDAPDWVFVVIMVVVGIGFPLVLVSAWVHDLPPPTQPPEARAGAEGGASVAAPPTAAAAASPPPAATPVEQHAGRVEPGARAPAPTRASVAVLPFVNMSGNRENEYFSDGLSEELLNMLAKVSALKVAARTSSFHFKGHTGDIAEVAQRLGVASVLEGSVRQSGSRVRITTQLIDAKDGYHLWSETFDRELDDIFAIQDEIATAVVHALKIKLLGREGAQMDAGGTTHAEAFKAYLRGMHYRNRGSDEAAVRSAVTAYRQAIELDPNYAQAWAGLSFALDDLARNNFADLEEVVDQARDAALKAIELAPGLADGYQVLANVELAYRLDKAAALKAIKTAMRLDPGSVGVLIQHSWIHFCLGDLETSLATARMAQELDPVSTLANHHLAYALYFARHYDEAIPVFRQALALDPHHPRPHYGIAMCQYQLGDVRAAATEVALEPLDWMRFSGLAILERKLSNDDEAEAAMASLIEGYRDNGLYQQSQVHAQWGDLDAAMEALERAHAIGDPGVSQLLVDPLLDPVRADARFQALVQKVGFN